MSRIVCGGAPAKASEVIYNVKGEDAFYFALPSGNMRCVWQKNQVGCSMLEFDFEGTPEPTDCDFGWDPSEVWLDATVFEAGSCVSERLDAWHQDKVPVLAFGASYASADLACLAATDGLTCWNTRTHHGFKLSRKAQLTW